MSFIKTQFVHDYSDTNVEEKNDRDDHDKLSSCIRRPYSRSTVEIENNTRDFHLRGI